MGGTAEGEGMQRSWCLGGCPRGLDEHRPGMAASDLADPAMVGGTETRLPHARVKAEVAHQLLRAPEPADVADRRHQSGRYGQIDTRDRHQSPDRRVVGCRTIW